MVPAPSAAFPGTAGQARLAGRVGWAAFALLVVIGAVTRLGLGPARLGLAVAVAIGAALPLFLLPLRPHFPWAVAATAGVVALGNADSRAVVWFALVVVAGWCVLVGGVRLGAVYWAGVVLVFAGEWGWAARDPGWVPWAAGVTVSALAALLIRQQLVLVARLQAAQAELAEQTRLSERSRIARELHDVIAHSLTVSLLHVTAARLTVAHEPAEADRALGEAERLARQALDEVRATVGLLRTDGDGTLAPPVPGAELVPVLVEEYRRAGAQVSLSIDGDLTALPATVGTTLYRIVQEALTNAAKHAPGAPITVEVTATRRDLQVRVDSAGPPGPGRGMGLTNMAERASALGGRCRAGPGGHGWLVTATLPRRTQPTAIG